MNVITPPHPTPPQWAKKQQKYAAVYQACANYLNRATRVCKMVAAHLKASKLTSMNSDFLSCTQLEIIAQRGFQVPVTLG